MCKYQERDPPFSGQGYRPSTASLNNIPFHCMFLYNRAASSKAFKSWQCNKFVQHPHNFKISEIFHPVHSFSVLPIDIVSLFASFQACLYLVMDSDTLSRAYGILWRSILAITPHHHHKAMYDQMWVYSKLTQLKRGCHSF